MLILPARRAYQILYFDAGLESARDRSAVAHFAENDVPVELDHYPLPTANPLAEGHTQAGARDVDDGAVDRLAGARKNFEFSGVLGKIAGFPAALGVVSLDCAGEGAYRVVELV